MSMEQRIRYLLVAAQRADAEGDARRARILRRMAEESQPLVVVRRTSRSAPAESLACSAE